jgi:hypothetical protein
MSGHTITLSGRVCNRGTRAVGSKLPATFYGASGAILCVSFTTAPVQGNGDCQAVSCGLDATTIGTTVRMVVNDDGNGGRTTLECQSDNNSDQIDIMVSDCIVP